jgi:hypothetical protein
VSQRRWFDRASVSRLVAHDELSFAAMRGYALDPQNVCAAARICRCPRPSPYRKAAIGYSGVLLRWAPTKYGASLVACRALLRLPDEPARLSNAELTGKALRERNELCAKSAIGCRSKPDEPHAVELLRAQQARLRTRPHFECCEYP